MEYQGQQVCDAGCEGGLMPNAFNFVLKNNGIDTEDSYPYTAEDGTCQTVSSAHGRTLSFLERSHRSHNRKLDNGFYHCYLFVIRDFQIPGNEDQMAAYLVNQGPVSIAVDADDWQYYIGGVFEFPWCGTSLDHGKQLMKN
jgi:hypothetical protein